MKIVVRRLVAIASPKWQSWTGSGIIWKFQRVNLHQTGSLVGARWKANAWHPLWSIRPLSNRQVEKWTTMDWPLTHSRRGTTVTLLVLDVWKNQSLRLKRQPWPHTFKNWRTRRKNTTSNGPSRRKLLATDQVAVFAVCAWRKKRRSYWQTQKGPSIEEMSSLRNVDTGKSLNWKDQTPARYLGIQLPFLICHTL